MRCAARQGFALTIIMVAFALVRLPKLVGGLRLGFAAGVKAA